MKRINEIIQSLEFGTEKVSPFSKEQIFNAFKQGTVEFPLLMRIGGGGNCASVALIKTVIATFGFDAIFKSIVIDDKNSRYLIDLKDDDKSVYILSFNNFEFGSKKSAFELNNSDDISKDIFEFAKFCFAVMAEVKRCNYRINKKYSRAINDLNKGESAQYIHEYLGLKATEVKDISIENLSTLKNIILWNDPHAVYSSEGFYDEFFNGYEKVQPLSQLQVIHGDGTDRYKPSGANLLS